MNLKVNWECHVNVVSNWWDSSMCITLYILSKSVLAPQISVIQMLTQFSKKPQNYFLKETKHFSNDKT